MSMQRHDVASTLMRRCLNVICPLECNHSEITNHPRQPHSLKSALLVSIADKTWLLYNVHEQSANQMYFVKRADILERQFYKCSSLSLIIKLDLHKFLIISLIYIHGHMYQPLESKKCLGANADSEGPDQTARPHSLIRAIAVRLKNHWVLQNVSVELKSSDESLRMRRMILTCTCTFCTFALDKVHICCVTGSRNKSMAGQIIHHIVC